MREGQTKTQRNKGKIEHSTTPNVSHVIRVLLY